MKSVNARRRRRSPRVRGGFTLLELLLVLAILVVIMGIATINLGSASTDAKVQSTEVQMKSIERAIDMYKIRINSVPESLEALRDGPGDSSKQSRWTGPILDEIPVDGWGNPLIYSKNGNSYEIRSGGIDGQTNTEDDLTLEGN